MKTDYEKLCDEVADAFMVALDQKDPEDGGHCLRVAQMSVHVGRLMGLSEQELRDLRRGALLHDIGKLCLPDAILLKPGKLTPQEYEIIKTHPDLGAEILRRVSFLQAAAQVVAAHHERWDGSGYPRGLRGEAIPLFARISAVVGAYDALISYRPYRPGYLIEQALQFIEEDAGKAYDPQVVSVFLKLKRGEK